MSYAEFFTRRMARVSPLVRAAFAWSKMFLAGDKIHRGTFELCLTENLKFTQERI
jgi:hypothetical protein